jgi:hypothetical protein
MKTLMTAILALALSGLAFAYGDQDEDTLRCNPTNGQWTYEDSKSVLKSNPANGQWTFEDTESTLRPNPATGQWLYVR